MVELVRMGFWPERGEPTHLAMLTTEGWLLLRPLAGPRVEHTHPNGAFEVATG